MKSLEEKIGNRILENKKTQEEASMEIETKIEPVAIMMNAIRCNCPNHQVIFSGSKHDYYTCQCGKISVDGGHDYMKRGGNPEDYTDISIAKMSDGTLKLYSDIKK